MKSFLDPLHYPNKMVDIASFKSFWKSSFADLSQDKLNSLIKEQWLFFNQSRENRPENYMNVDHWMKSYLALFFLTNVQRNSYLIDKHLSKKLSAFVKFLPTIRVVDYGAGPLSATIALLCSIAKSIKEEKLTDIACLKIEIHAVDIGQSIVEWGNQLIHKTFHFPFELEVVYHESHKSLPDNLHVALASNSINEIPPKLRFPLFTQIFESLVTQGVFFILEPGQEGHSRRLYALRDEALEKFKGNLNIVGPCPHHKKCPLGESSTRSEWCWFKAPWTPPEDHLQIAGSLGLDHTQLSFSYLVLQKRTPKETERSTAISDAIKLEPSFFHYAKNNLHQGSPRQLQSTFKDAFQKNPHKQLLCLPNGQIGSRVLGHDKATRGEGLTPQREEIVVLERSGVNPLEEEKSSLQIKKGQENHPLRITTKTSGKDKVQKERSGFAKTGKPSPKERHSSPKNESRHHRKEGERSSSRDGHRSVGRRTEETQKALRYPRKPRPPFDRKKAFPEKSSR